VSNGRLYIGSAEKKLLVLDPATGKAITSLDVGAKPTTRPSADGSRIIVGTDGGQILVINPDALK
jgi:outer membrane protein assembly factor BamB